MPDVGLLVTPTSPTPAFRFGEKTDNPLQMYLSDIFTVTLNLAGLPGLSIPCGLTGGRLTARHLIPGAWQVTVTAGDGRSWSATAIVSAAATAEVSLP